MADWFATHMKKPSGDGAPRPRSTAPPPDDEESVRPPDEALLPSPSHASPPATAPAPRAGGGDWFDGVMADRNLRATIPARPPTSESDVRPGSPRDRLEKLSERVFGSAAPYVNPLAVSALQNSPIGGVPLVLKGGAPVGGALAGPIGLSLGGVPGAAAFAGAGGTAAGMAERAFRGEPNTADTMTQDALIQGLSELIAPVIGKSAEKFALPIYRGAFGPGQEISNSFGDVSKRGLKEGLPVHPDSVARAAELTTASTAAKDAMVDAASPTAAPIEPREILSALKPAWKMARDQRAAGVATEAETAGDMAALSSRTRAILKEMGVKRAVQPIPEGPPTIVRVPSRQPAFAESGDQAIARSEFQLGHQADLAPSRVFQPTEPETRAARQLGASTAGVIPSRILNGPPPLPRVTEFVTPGTPAVPGRPAIPGGITLKRSEELGGVAQRKASKNLVPGAAAPKSDALAKADEQIAHAYQRANEARLPETATSPGLAKQNENTQELLGVLRGMERNRSRYYGGEKGTGGLTDVVAATGGATMGAAGAGTALAGARAIRAAGRSAASRLAIGMDRSGRALQGTTGTQLTNAVRALASQINGSEYDPADFPMTPSHAPADDPSMRRPDGSRKGQGFLGTLKRPDGSVSSELSVGVNIDGKEIDIPTLVPSLTAAERDWLLTHDPDPKAIPPAIIDKAVAHARKRLAAGQPVFAP